MNTLTILKKKEKKTSAIRKKNDNKKKFSKKNELLQSLFHTHFCGPSLLFLPNLAKRLLGDAAGKSGGLGGRERSSSQETSMWFIPVCPVWCPRWTQVAHRHARTDAQLFSRVPPACDAGSHASFLACLIPDAQRGSTQLLNSGTDAADVSRRHPAAEAAASTPDEEGSGCSFRAHMILIFVSESSSELQLYLWQFVFNSGRNLLSDLSLTLSEDNRIHELEYSINFEAKYWNKWLLLFRNFKTYFVTFMKNCFAPPQPDLHQNIN